MSRWIEPLVGAYTRSMATLIETFTNTETNMEAYVYASTDKPGTYNVTLKDLDSGLFVSGTPVGIPDVEVAKAKAKKVAGLK